MGFKKITMLFLALVLIWGLLNPVWAGPRINVVVKTIHASQGAKFIDPRLAGIVGKLQPVFRYSSYRLLREDALNLSVGEVGKVVLPGNRELMISPRRISGNRASFQLTIFKERKQVFQTSIELLNNNSLTVGGAVHQDGYLLFDIFNSF